MKKIFAYGILQYPSVQKEVLGRELKKFQQEPYIAKGFRLRQLVIEDIVYMCAVIDEGSEIIGTIWEIEETDIPLLDEFETNAYEKFDLLSVENCIIYIKN